MRFYEPVKKNGTYVDVGAHHPSRFSNTKLFYDVGWRGLSIDPRPGFAKEYLRERPEDIALESAIANTPGELTYFLFDEPALNGFDAELSTKRDQESNYNIVDQVKVKVEPLASILQNNFQEGELIDFLSVDVEGFDHEVLQSNDWDKFRPTFVLVEIYGQTIQEVLNTPSSILMSEVGYSIVSRTRHTVFFQCLKQAGSIAA